MHFNDILSLVSLQTVKKYSYLFKVFIIVFFAYLFANIINSEFIAPLMKIDEQGINKARNFKRATIKKSNSREYYDIIIDRNIFDSTDKPVPGGGSKISDASGDGEFDLSGPSVPSTLPVKLIGTIVLDVPSWSIAIITGGSQKKSNVYRISDIIYSSATLVAVERNKILIKNNGRLEHIEIKDESPGFIAEKQDTDVSINQVGDDKFVVSRRELNAAFSDLSKILTQARVVPHFEDGKTVGFKIFAIQPGSIYKKLGLNNGDIIARVNGVMIDDPTKGLQLFNSLKTESNIDLDIIQGGVKKTLKYEIK